MSQGNGLKTQKSTKLQLIKELIEAFEMLTHPSFEGDHSNKQEYLVIKKFKNLHCATINSNF